MNNPRDLSNLIETIRHQRHDLQQQMLDGSLASRTTSQLLEKIEQLRLRIQQTQLGK